MEISWMSLGSDACGGASFFQLQLLLDVALCV